MPSLPIRGRACTNARPKPVSVNNVLFRYSSEWLGLEHDSEPQSPAEQRPKPARADARIWHAWVRRDCCHTTVTDRDVWIKVRTILADHGEMATDYIIDQLSDVLDNHIAIEDWRRVAAADSNAGANLARITILSSGRGELLSTVLVTRVRCDIF